MRHASAIYKLALGILVATMVATSLPGSTALGLEERILNYGNIEMLANDSLRFHGEYRRWFLTLKWPIGWWERGTICFCMPYFSFESLTMTTQEGMQTVVLNGWGYPWGSGIGGGMFIMGGEKGLMEWRKYYPPYFETDGIPKRPYPDEDDVDYTMGPDQRVELLGRAGNSGVRYHRFMDVWVNQNHDDYFIQTTYHRPDWIRNPDAEVVVKHPAQAAIASFGDGYYWQATSVGVREYNRLAYDIWYQPDEWVSYMIRPVEFNAHFGLPDIATGTSLRDSLLVNYGWDEDNPKNTVEPYDLGDPAEVNGEFLSYQIPGEAVLFASRKPVAGKTETTRPEDWGAEDDWYRWADGEANLVYTEIDDNRDPTGTTYNSWAEYYYSTYYTDYASAGVIKNGWQSQPVAQWPAGQSSELWGSWRRNPANTWQYQTLPKRTLATVETGTDLNCQTISGKYNFLYMGPYVMNKTDEIVRLVWAVGVGGVGPDSARAMGARWAAGQMTPEQKRELVLGGGGKLVDPTVGSNYQVWYKGGRDSLFRTLERAYWNFLGKAIGPYNVPDPPPTPDLVVTSGPDRIDLKWWYPDVSYYNDPDTGNDDFKEWRVYRKKGEREIGTMDERGTTDPDMLSYVKIATVTDRGDGDTLRYADSTVQRGQPYYYYVTAVDDGSENTKGMIPGQELESSQMANRIEFAAVPFKPAAENTDNIRVVPNPYNVNSGGGNYTGSAFDANKVLFVNLPAYCMIYIYTEAGELVKTLNHNTRNADHAWEQLTDAGQYARSGIYVAKITDATNEAKTVSYPDAIVKFVIIR